MNNSDDAFVFTCAACGQALTQPLRALPAGTEYNMEDAKELLPRGFFSVIQTPGMFDAELGDFAINLQDLTDAIPGGDRIGCCGSDGTRGPHFFCRKGHGIAREHSDCWMPHFASLIQSAVKQVWMAKEVGK